MTPSVSLAKDRVVRAAQRAARQQFSIRDLQVLRESVNVLAHAEDKESRTKTVRFVGGPKDGDKIALEYRPGHDQQYTIQVPAYTAAAMPSYSTPQSFDPMRGVYIYQYHLRTNLRTGEKALVLEGLEGWE